MPVAKKPEGLCGSYLVPYSFRRLDSFAGYAAGMPSPAYFQALWEGGAALGGTLRDAASAKLLRNAQESERVSDLVRAVEAAISAGFLQVLPSLIASVEQALQTLTGSLGDMGEALQFAVLATRDQPATPTHDELHRLRDRFGERVLTLLPQYAHASCRDELGVAVGALCLWYEGDCPNRLMVLETLQRLALGSVAVSFPASLRGAAVGALVRIAETATLDVAEVVRSSPARGLGDFLAGLFSIAREQVQELVREIDARIRDLSEAQFLTELPSLRRAFSFFPPREKHKIATQVVALQPSTEKAEEQARALVEPMADNIEARFADARALEARVQKWLSRWGFIEEQ